MTITLLEDVTSSQGLVAVSNPTETRLDAVLQIEDELVVVRNDPSPGGDLVLGRGVLGSTRAAHASGATLAAYEPGASAGNFNGGTITDPLNVQTTNTGQTPLAVQGADGQTAALIKARHDDLTYFEVGGVPGVVLSANPSSGASALLITTSAITLTDENSAILLDIELGYVYLGSSGQLAVIPGGQTVLSAHTAPADGDINAGECALWFDQTDGAAKLKIKAKSADGTIVTGSVNLA